MASIRILILLGGASALCYAKPQNMAVIHGTAELEDFGCCIEVTTSDRAVLEWESFSIDPNSMARFVQPAASSAVLNRVVGSEVSQLLGLLESNGQVFLVNRNGIIIGQDGRVDTAGFLAVTADIDLQDFLDGRVTAMEPEAGAITHLGSIETSGGPIALIAHKIEVEGQIASETLLSPKQLIYIRPDSLETIESKRATAMAVNAGKGSDATTVVMENGKIFLRASEIEVKEKASLSSYGGKVHLFADEVALSGGQIDTSGHFNGGDIIVGAQQTTVSQDFDLKSDATAGFGGTVIVWSDDTTEFHGKLSASALESGDGGFAEVSGKKSLWITSHPDLHASGGKAGTLLLDPGPVTINHSASTGPNTFGDSYLSTQLATTSTVVATASATGGGAQTITIQDGSVDITWDAATTLTLSAGQNIIAMSGGTISGGAGSMILQTTEPLGSQPSGNYDGVALTAISLSTTSGDITITGVGGTTNSGNTCNGVTLTGGTITTATGTIDITGSAGGSGGENNVGVYVHGANISVTGSTGSIEITGAGGLNANSGDINTGILVDNTSNITSSSSGDIALDGTAGSSTANTFGVGLASYFIGITGGGEVSIQGTGSTANTSGCGGVSIGVGSITNTGASPISITGSYTANTQNGNAGIYFGPDPIMIEGADGDISLQGTVTGSFCNNCTGVLGNSSATIILGSSGTGTIGVTGDASGTSGANNIGISLYGLNVGKVASAGFTMMGTGGGGAGMGNHGIVLNTTTAESFSYSTPFLWTLEGASGSTGDVNHGVYLQGLITADNFPGEILISGATVGSSASYGVYITSPMATPVFSGVTVNTSDNAIFDGQNAGAVFTVVAGTTGVTTGINASIGGQLTLSTDGGTTVLSVNGNNTAAPIILSAGSIMVNGSSTPPYISTTDSTGAITLEATDALTIQEGINIQGSGTAITLEGSSIAIDETIAISGNGGTITFNGPIAPTGTGTINTTGAALVFSSALGTGSYAIDSGSGSMTFDADLGTMEFPLGTLSLTSSDTATGIDLSGSNVYADSISLTGGAITIGQTVYLTSEGISLDASGPLVFSNGSSIMNATQITASSPSTITFGSGVTVQGGNPLTLVAGTNIVGGSGLVIESGSVGSSIILVVDNNNPTPPSIGPGYFTFASDTTLSIPDGKVQLYAANLGVNTFPAVINGVPYTPGSFNMTTGVYTPGTNEFFGYWYNVPPFPPDPPFEVIFKVGQPPSLLVAMLNAALVEPVLTLAQSNSQSLSSTIAGQQTPKPSNACKGTPSVSIRTGGGGP